MSERPEEVTAAKDYEDTKGNMISRKQMERKGGEEADERKSEEKRGEWTENNEKAKKRKNKEEIDKQKIYEEEGDREKNERGNRLTKEFKRTERNNRIKGKHRLKG